MARRRRSNAQRDSFPISRSADLRGLLVRRPVRLLPLRPIEDRRTYHPLRAFRPAQSLGRRDAARVVLERPRQRPGRSFFPIDVFKFAVPRKVAICVRRKERRETLFAKKLTRSGAGAPKRRNYWSAISCKR